MYKHSVLLLSGLLVLCVVLLCGYSVHATLDPAMLVTPPTGLKSAMFPSSLNNAARREASNLGVGPR